MEENNSNQATNPSASSTQTQPVSNPVNNQKGILPIILGVLVFLVVIVGGTYYLGTKNATKLDTAISNSIQSSPTESMSPSPIISNISPKFASFMKDGEIWVKDFTTNQEKKVSKTAKAEGPVFSPSGRHLYYFQIVHAGGGLPRYSLFVSDKEGLDEKTFTKGANQYASKLKWSNDGKYLGMILFGNDIPGGANYSEEAYIYDADTKKETLISAVKGDDLSTDQYILKGSCNQLPTQYVTFCNEYASYLKIPRGNDYKGGYKGDKYSKSKYTKPNYRLTRSEKLENGLVVLEYYTGEPQNPESKWGVGGGTFLPGYDKGVTETYTILLDEQSDKVLIEIPRAVHSDFIF